MTSDPFFLWLFHQASTMMMLRQESCSKGFQTREDNVSVLGFRQSSYGCCFLPSAFRRWWPRFWWWGLWRWGNCPFWIHWVQHGIEATYHGKQNAVHPEAGLVLRLWCDKPMLMFSNDKISSHELTRLRIVESNWGLDPSNLPTRYLSPGSVRMLHVQSGLKVSQLGFKSKCFIFLSLHGFLIFSLGDLHWGTNPTKVRAFQPQI